MIGESFAKLYQTADKMKRLGAPLAEQVAGESERLVGWQEQLEALRRRVRIYEQTLVAIEQAEQATMRTATVRSQSRVKKKVSAAASRRAGRK